MSETSKYIKSYNKVFWILFTFPFAVMLILFTLISAGKLGYMPPFDELENPETNIATQIISEDNKVLGTFYLQNRTYVGYNELPPYLIDALIATEDIRFYKHSGIDPKGLVRVIVRTLLMGDKSSGGGSTITQQLAKNLFPRDTTFYPSKIRRSVVLTLTKFREWVTAIKLERSYTKNEIIAMYFNQFDFLYQAVGIHSAAKVYFNVAPDSLSIEQAALLVGMAKNPGLYNPKRFPERAKSRRDIVFSQMYKYGYLDKESRDSLINIPIELDFQKIDHDEGIATYFREYLRRTLTAKEPKRRNYFLYDSYREDSILWHENPMYGWCNKNLKPDGTPYNIYTNGLKIYTPVNYFMQKYAEEAIAEHLGGYLQAAFFREKKGVTGAPFSKDLTPQQIRDLMYRAMINSERGRILRNMGVSNDSIYRIFNTPVEMTIFNWKGDIDTVMTPMDSIRYFKHILQAGFMSMDPTTGYVKAYVGGLDMRYFKYDHVTQGKRQAGSTFKPFLYVLAMQEDGYDPCLKVPNVSVSFSVRDTIWSPRSMSDPQDLGQMRSLRWGLARSENNISAYLVQRFKPQPIAEIAYKCGIKSYIDPVPPMIYGTSDMSVEEMVASYATFANKGIHIDPVFVTQIRDRNGNLLAEFSPNKKEAISAYTAYLMIKLMEGVTSTNLGEGYRRGGTAAGLRYGKYGFTGEIAGKTGTTQNNSDGWFIGITPKLISGLWVGAEDRSVHFDRTAMGSGTSMAMPVWGNYMQRIYADSTLGISQEDIFEKPEGFSLNLDCNSKSTDSDMDENFEYNELEF
ncbi:MAG: transglycosylase domain-containing protein [Bacteroidales bacterium]|nr:transglycosylase domain-containing protein [Bacteroidales bacterium]